jgi:hypothetical protein
MKILFVSHSPTQTVITLKKTGDINTPNEYQTHLYNHDGGYTEKWNVTDTFEEATYMHKQLCEKCYIKVNM